MLQFLGDVNLFHGRFGHAPGGTDAAVSYVRPHELDIVASAEADALPVTLSQVLTVGAQTRIEFKRQDDGSYVDVEMPRSEFALCASAWTCATAAGCTCGRGASRALPMAHWRNRSCSIRRR